jgi:Lrp/AsnC family transcriptional regulator for asnA, asnC and gidA
MRTNRSDTEKKRPLDDTDRKIISALRANPQGTNRDIAGVVSVSEMTVASRVDALINDNLMKVTIQRDVRTLGSRCLALIELDVEGALVDKVAKRVADFARVFAVTVVIGTPQIVMMAFARDNLDLQRFMQDDLARVKGIRHANVSLALQTLKADTGIAAL